MRNRCSLYGGKLKGGVCTECGIVHFMEIQFSSRRTYE